MARILIVEDEVLAPISVHILSALFLIVPVIMQFLRNALFGKILEYRS